MATKDAIGIPRARVTQGSRSHFRRHAEPARIQAVDEAGKRLALEVELLQLQIEKSSQIVQPHVVGDYAVELVPVNCQMAQAGILPSVFLIHANADQMRHDVGEPVVMVPFHPDDFDLALGVRKFADVAEEFPVFLSKTAKIKVGKN